MIEELAVRWYNVEKATDHVRWYDLPVRRQDEITRDSERPALRLYVYVEGWRKMYVY